MDASILAAAAAAFGSDASACSPPRRAVSASFQCPSPGRAGVYPAPDTPQPEIDECWMRASLAFMDRPGARRGQRASAALLGARRVG